jgi:formylmethanofuran dehydrogenase subunit E
MKNRIRNIACLLLAIFCIAPLLASSQQNHGQSQKAESSEAMEQVRQVHGGTGPFAVAGYRIGERALKELKLKRGGFDFEVTHEAPAEVQWSCIVDGLQAATGASLGKLNLRMLKVDSPNQLRSVVTSRESKQSVTFKLRESFIKHFLNLPHEKLEAAGAEVLKLPDEEIFEIEKE